MGLASALLANLILGSPSLYWKQFSTMPTVLALAWRVLLSLLAIGLILITNKKLKHLQIGMNIKILAIHAAAGILIAANWASFIWASVHGHFLESALGYLIAPLTVLICAKVRTRQTTSRTDVIAMLVATAAISAVACTATNFSHWVYVSIGFSWGLYSYLKTVTPLDPATGLFIETACLTIGCLIWMAIGPMHFSPNDLKASFSAPILLAGFVSVTPLLLFAYSSKFVDMHSLALCQLALPTTQIFIAFLYSEHSFTASIFLYVCVVWAAIFVLKLASPER